MANATKQTNEFSAVTNVNFTDEPAETFRVASNDRPTTTQSIHLQFETEHQQPSPRTNDHPKPTLIHSSSMVDTSRLKMNVSNSVNTLEIKHSNSDQMIRKQTDDKRAATNEVDVILARKISSMDLESVGRTKSKLSLNPVVAEDPKWRDIGDYEVLRRTKCRRLYSRLGPSKDLALFYRSGKFYAMEAWCSHMGGPLYEGDIEEHKGACHVMCPWHAFMFDLTTGESDIGLKQQVFPVKCENGHVFVEYISQLALYPYL
ncbi:unnamed protein product [Candidula unifasciata]|uniref:Rieske domain-containing protein n=1 Tax=Candidula unifasciata TaxID=100452 RepID=A0A8S3YYF9_9EUPU|nr:unnamed protein product [Candidula unifasciata]